MIRDNLHFQNKDISLELYIQDATSLQFIFYKKLLLYGISTPFSMENMFISRQEWIRTIAIENRKRRGPGVFWFNLMAIDWCVKCIHLSRSFTVIFFYSDASKFEYLPSLFRSVCLYPRFYGLIALVRLTTDASAPVVTESPKLTLWHTYVSFETEKEENTTFSS